jgi:hypothetical protein
MNGFIGHCPSFGILKNVQEGNVSETVSVSVVREIHTLLDPLERTNFNHWTRLSCDSKLQLYKSLRSGFVSWR